MEKLPKELHVALLTLSYMQCVFYKDKDIKGLTELDFLQEYKKCSDIISLLYPSVVDINSKND